MNQQIQDLPTVPNSGSNFDFLESTQPQIFRAGVLAERYFAEDPTTSVMKLRQLGEIAARFLAARLALHRDPGEPQVEIIRRLREEGHLDLRVVQLFHALRVEGNRAVHDLETDHRTALDLLKLARELTIWLHRTFHHPDFKPGPFLPPQPPQAEMQGLRAELGRLRAEAKAQRSEAERSQATAEKEAVARLCAEARARQESEDRAFFERFAQEAEADKARLAQELSALQAQSVAMPSETTQRWQAAAIIASDAIVLDEASTRLLLDQQLRDAGWDADSGALRFSNGTRPQKGKNLAIAEWPTATGPADYVLFAGLIPLAAVEAKRKHRDVSGALQQAKRYSRGFLPSKETLLPSDNWGAEGEFRLPFVFSANGRPYLRQVATKSGIWFCDIRRPDNHGHALDGWYTPEGLMALLKRDEFAAHERLKQEPFNYGFHLRPYQQDAIVAAEGAIENGQREMLLAMATGTGKTKTCIALIYRLLKTQRFRRFLFLVDRSALGEQAANAFKDTRMESLQTFADTFGIKELDEQTPDSDTSVHIATIQGMVQRVLNQNEPSLAPSVDQYDCIIVDECHRGYLLDRELSDTEMGFRNFEDYISKYRRVLDYFDAYKVGLTATPALHTTQIFGAPIYTYSYREAVIDGFLVDHEPPVQINTELSTHGIVWKAGEHVTVYDSRRDQVELYTTPDEIKLDVEDFNRKVITVSFNQVVCDFLAQELDPSSRQKTLIFCATDAHSDLVVDLLKKSFAKVYGSIDDDAILKITGAADKPLQLIRRFKNEHHPNIAVTVDLLTTGIDVPEICNLVFLRRVNSRILFDQMMGRATRLCDEIDKETFRIFDAVKIYEALQGMTAMQPVVVNPNISFTQLAQELVQVSNDDARALVRDQFIAKLQRKKQHFSESVAEDFETRAGMSPGAFIQKLKSLPLPDIAAWFTQNPDLGEILDRKGEGPGAPIFISEHADQLLGTERGYGKGSKPEDYLKAFTAFIQSHSNDIPALVTVLTRPRELTRKQLRELALELDTAGFSEANLATAWREMTNQDVAARIVGYIRQAAIGDALIPYEQRVDQALTKMLASKSWTTPQRQWLQKIAAQTKANLIVDRDAIDDPDLIFRREGGGFARLDRLFGGELQLVLDTFNDTLWNPAA